MDSTKKPLCAVTMVYSDYFFLERWYRYYSQQIGAENLFILSHGNDPKHRDIAPDANVINVPRDPNMTKFDRRRWRMMGQIASGLLEFYNWALVSDVDEILIVDPDKASGLLPYLSSQYPQKRTAPLNICPLGLQIVHMPNKEPDQITDGDSGTILSRRRHFYPSRNYSKPCLIGAPAAFGPGGHRNNLGIRHMDPDLYLLHLNFFDLPRLEARAEQKKQVVEIAKQENPDFEKKHPWDDVLNQYNRIITNYEFKGEDIALPHVRSALAKQRQKYANQYVLGRFQGDSLYLLPERFGQVF